MTNYHVACGICVIRMLINRRECKLLVVSFAFFRSNLVALGTFNKAITFQDHPFESTESNGLAQRQFEELQVL